jgi:4-amino-4-deoxy-L-arabinose transferase-like glycosyltransferase
MPSDAILLASARSQTNAAIKNASAVVVRSETVPQPPWGQAAATADVWILITVFVLALLPFAVSFVLMYPDEPHYLDAGVLMGQTKDYLMPACPNGAAPDFIKPIFTYWVIAASYALFGTTLAAARLPFLLAGAAVIWLTHRLALMLTASATAPAGSRAAATLSCVVLICNPLFCLSAIRCLPDIWLCLFLLVSAYGFIGLLALEAPTTTHALMAYVGVGLAVLTKGVPALLFLAYVLLFACCNPWRLGSWRRLIHVRSMALGTVVATAWFVIVLCTHGIDSLKLLWSDQITHRALRDPWTFAYRFPLALVLLVLACLPWLWPLWKLAGRWRGVLPSSRCQRVACGFILPWIILSMLATSATINFSVRYMLPMFPLLAVFCGVVLARVDAAILRTCFRRLLAGTLGVVVIAIVGSMALGAQLGVTLLELVAGLGLIAIVVLVAAVGFRGSWLRAVQASAVAFLLIIPIAHFSVKKIIRPELEEQLVQRLRLDHLDTRQVAGYIGRPGPGSRLQLALGPRVKLMQWETWPSAGLGSRSVDAELPSVIVLPEQWSSLLPAEAYLIRPAASVFCGPPSQELVRALFQGRLQACLLDHRRRYCIAVRIDSAPPRVETSPPTR